MPRWLPALLLLSGCTWLTGPPEPDLRWGGIDLRSDGAIVTTNKSSRLILDYKTMKDDGMVGPVYAQLREQFLAGGATELLHDSPVGTFRLPDGSGARCAVTNLAFVSALCSRFPSRSLVEPWASMDLQLDKAIVTVTTEDSAHLAYLGVPLDGMKALDAQLQEALVAQGWTRADDQRPPRDGARYANDTVFTTPEGKEGLLTIQGMDGVPSVGIEVR